MSNGVSLTNRLDQRRPDRTWRFLTISVYAWAVLAFHFLLTDRPFTGYVCTAETLAAFWLLNAARSHPRRQRLIANLSFGITTLGIVVESLFSGQAFSDSPFLLCCVGLMAAHQLGVRAAVTWTLLAISGFFVASFAFPNLDPLRAGTVADRIVIQVGIAIVVFVMSRQAHAGGSQFLHDETTEYLAEQTRELQEQTRLMSLAEEITHVGHWRWDLQSDELTLSAEARRICGLPDACNGPSDISLLVNCFDAETAQQLEESLLKAAAKQSSFSFCSKIRSSRGSRHVSCQGFSEQSLQRKIVGVFGVLKDQTDTFQTQKELRRKAAELDQLAKFDPLTGLANRHSFQVKLQEAIAKTDRTKQEMALLLIDLDGFKEINDTKGHPYGDRVLKEVANRLRAVIRDGDTVARLGGDEFTVIVNAVKSDLDVSLVAGRLIRAICQPFDLDGQQVFLGASVGAAICPRHTTLTDKLLSYADTAMYAAKGQGTRVEIYDTAMTAAMVGRQTLEFDLQQAWEEKQFELVYQPQIGTGERPTGVEALLRWRRGDQWVSPVEFIPQLEATGSIVRVGKWVLRQACLQARMWADSGINLCVSVNISPVQFRDPNFVDVVWEALEATGLPGSQLDLELTESVLINDMRDTVATLKLIKEEGISLSIDDFGTGYSSLAYLKHLPIDRLKIDRAFVKDIPTTDDGTIAKSIIALAHSLGLKVLAEGVETKEQLDFLNSQACDEYQGYYFSRPLETAACEVFLRKQMSVAAL